MQAGVCLWFSRLFRRVPPVHSLVGVCMCSSTRKAESCVGETLSHMSLSLPLVLAPFTFSFISTQYNKRTLSHPTIFASPTILHNKLLL